MLAALWAGGEPLVPAQVQRALDGDGPELAYTSILTTLRRLHAKGLVRREVRGRAFAYSPTGDAAREAAGRMHAQLGAGPGRQLVLSHFVASLTAEEEQLLLTVLAQQDSP